MSDRQYFRVPLPMRIGIIPLQMLFRTGHTKFFARMMAEGTRQQGGRFFKKYSPTKNDVVIATLARCGTHWMMQIALQIVFRGEAEYDYIYDLIAWPDYPFTHGVMQLNETPPPSPTGLRVIKTHLTADHIPLNTPAKFITVIRDPKEFFVSTYHFAPQALDFLGWPQLPVSEWFEYFMNDIFPFGDWAEHTAGWWAQRKQPNVLVIPFNYLKVDMEAHIDKVCQLLEVELTSDERAKVIQKASFDYMKEINLRFSPMPEGSPVTDIVRSGKTGSGEELLSQAQMKAIDEHCKLRLKALGSDFPYDEIFG